ncbi:MAG: PilZ domain-containing protein [bacterium]|nr:PilZ domain-containing protein [bacterium]MCP5068055.1 PilZ domain-containing protein [bacterium]
MSTALPTLSTGSRLLLVGESGGAPISSIVVRVSDGLIWISGVDEPGEPGDTVRMVYVVPGDAQYHAPARVEFIPPETLALRRIGEWRRQQRRAQVRLNTHGIQLKVQRSGEGNEPAKTYKLAMVDISAGGAAARGKAELASGDDVLCTFRLPGREAFHLDARVVRARPSGRGHILGFEFIDVSPEEQSGLRRWIYREESRRHHQAKRDAARARRELTK